MDEISLLLRARRLAGLTLAEVAGGLGEPLPLDPSRHKGWTGQLLEKALGASAGSSPAPDFMELGVELKTLPVDRAGVPTESTFVASLDLADPRGLEWAHAGVRKKLARVLWVPIEAERALPFPERRIGSAILWSPSPEEEALLRRDFEEIAELVAAGFVEGITARMGRALQLRPKAADARQLRWALEEEGWVRTPPRAFYLRRAFTRELVRRCWRSDGT